MRSRSAAQLGTCVMVALLAIVLGACSGPDAPQVVDSSDSGPPSNAGSADGSVDESADPSRITVSQDVADGLAQAMEDDDLTRWDRDTVDVAVTGEPTPRDVEILDVTLDELAALTDITFTRVGTAADLTVSFIPRDQWPPSDRVSGSGEDDEEEDDVVDMGLTLWESDEDGAITDADVYVDSALDQGLRNSTLSHELAHAVGLGHVECVTSVVDGGLDTDVAWELSDFDRDLVRAWYSSDLPLMTSSREVEDHVDISDDAATCDPWLLEAVSTDDEGLLACEVAFAEYRSCMPYDGLGPVPSLDAWTPTDWVSNDWIYDYDPGRFEVVDYEGQRVLCELEGAGRRPCEVTDGPGPVVDVTLWTDGEYMYDSP